MPNEAYRQAIDTAAQELGELMKRHEELETELEHVQDRIETLQFGLTALGAVSGIDPRQEYPDLYPEEMTPDLGFTDAVREALKSANPIMIFSPVLVRDELQKRGFDLTKYRNPLASIHTILKRLRASDEVIAHLDESTGKYLYSWNRSKGRK